MDIFLLEKVLSPTQNILGEYNLIIKITLMFSLSPVCVRLMYYKNHWAPIYYFLYFDCHVFVLSVFILSFFFIFPSVIYNNDIRYLQQQQISIL